MLFLPSCGKCLVFFASSGGIGWRNSQSHVLSLEGLEEEEWNSRQALTQGSWSVELTASHVCS